MVWKSSNLCLWAAAIVHLACVADGFLLSQTVKPSRLWSSANVDRQNQGARAPAVGKKLRMMSGFPDLSSALTQHPALAAFLASNILYVGQLLVQQRRESDGDPYEIMKSVQLYTVPEGRSVRITDYWRKDQRAVVVFLRSFG
mmetsp:Transcript_39841/g.83404  ORF Transcript_39841/g.83404 Transcript_39841/m.83404 type:complete len:143 (-) Transcript_39841:56-484(-)